MEGYPPDYIPADRREFYLEVLGAEAEAKALYSGEAADQVYEVE